MTLAHIISIFITTHLENTVFIFLWEKEAIKVIMWPWLRETNWPEAKGTLDSSFRHGGSGPFRIPWTPFTHLFIQQPFNECLLCARLWGHSEQHTKAMLSWVQSLQGEADTEWMSTARKTRSLAGVSVLKGLCPSKTSHGEAETDSEMCRGDWDLHRKPRALPTEESKSKFRGRATESQQSRALTARLAQWRSVYMKTPPSLSQQRRGHPLPPPLPSLRKSTVWSYLWKTSWHLWKKCSTEIAAGTGRS